MVGIGPRKILPFLGLDSWRIASSFLGAASVDRAEPGSGA